MKKLDEFKPRTNIDLGDPRIDVIRLCGREWLVLPFGMRQNRGLVPRIWKILPTIDRIRQTTSEIESAQSDDDTEWRKSAERRRSVAVLEMMSEENLELLSEIVHLALTRVYEITREEFLDLPIDPHELICTIDVIAAQTQVFVPKKEGGGQDSNTGERRAALPI